MKWLQQERLGLILCIGLAIPSHLLGQLYPLIGGPVIAILMGMLIGQFPFKRAPLPKA